MKDKITLAELLFSEMPSHWPSSSHHCVRSALRTLSKFVPLEKSFHIDKLPSLIDQYLYKEPGSEKNGYTLKTYRSRILRLAAERACGKPLRAWEARRFFERLTLTTNKEVSHGITVNN